MHKILLQISSLTIYFENVENFKLTLKMGGGGNICIDDPPPLKYKIYIFLKKKRTNYLMFMYLKLYVMCTKFAFKRKILCNCNGSSLFEIKIKEFSHRT